MLKQSNIIKFPIKYKQGNESKIFRQNSVNIAENILNSCSQSATSQQKKETGGSLRDWRCWKRRKVLLHLLCANENRVFSHWPHREKKRFLREKNKKKNIFRHMQKTKVTHTNRSYFVFGNGQVRETNFELELIKTSEFFLVDKSFYTNNSVIWWLSNKKHHKLSNFCILWSIVKVNW